MPEHDTSTESNHSESKPKKPFPVKWVILAVLIAAILIGTPFAIQYGIKTGLTKAGAQLVELEDVDFNPFIGELVIKNLRSTTGSEPELLVPRLLVELDWLPLFSKQIMVRKLELEGSTLKVEQNEQAQTRIAGILLPEKQEATEEEPQSSPWGFGVAELSLVGNKVVISTPDFTTHSELSDVSLKQLISWSPDQTADFAFNSTLNQAPFSGDIQLNLFEETPRIEGTIKIDQLNLSDFASLGGDAIETLSGKASVDIQFELKLAESGIAYQQNGMVALLDTELKTPDLSLNEPDMRYQGSLLFSINEGQQNLKTDGQLSTRQLTLNIPSPELTIGVGKAAWKGQFSFASQANAPSLNAQGSLQTGSIDVRKTGSKFESVHLNGLNINNLKLQELANIKAAGIQINTLRVATPAPKKASLLAVEQINIKQPAFLKQNQIRVDAINLKGTSSEVRLAKEGGLPLLNQLLASFESKSNDKAEPDASNKPMQIHVGGVDFGKNSQVNVVLETDAKPVRKKIKLKKTTIGTLNSAKPNTKTPVLIDAVIDKHASLNSKGHIKPFTKQLNLDLKTAIKALDLHDLSPLIQPQIGYNINSGQLNADSHLKIVNDQIDGKNKLTINNLQVESANSTATEKLNQQLPMPLDAALDLLRDENEDIKLEVPLTGDINAPNFELGDIINQAIGGAVKGTTTNLLKLALQPYGLIFMAAEKALEASASISLEPVLFSPGKSILEGKAEDYLEKIAGLMTQRPGIRIRVCGYATATDQANMLAEAKGDKKEDEKTGEAPSAEITETLTQLAGQRSDAIKAHLIEKASISAERLFTCLPKIDEKANAKPRVELLI